MQWFIVKDRQVNRAVTPPLTTVDPGVYPMLWVTSKVAKRWSRFWLPRENSALPRPRKFERCTVVPVSERIGFPPHVASAIRCAGSAAMYFAVLADAGGGVGVQQALVPGAGATPVWSSVVADNADRWPIACATMNSTEISPEIYFRDTAGMRTYP